jgi:hypothetical protein
MTIEEAIRDLSICLCGVQGPDGKAECEKHD